MTERNISTIKMLRDISPTKKVNFKKNRGNRNKRNTFKNRKKTVSENNTRIWEP